MNISSKSWLFKYWKFHENTYDLRRGKVSLCEMFWTTLWYILRDTVVAVVLGVIIAMPGPALLVLTGLIPTATGFLASGVSYAWWIYLLAIPAGAVVWASTLGIGVAVVYPVVKLVTYINNKREDSKFTRELKKELAREESLRFANLWQKFKIAKEEKLCPIIRVIEED